MKLLICYLLCAVGAVLIASASDEQRERDAEAWNEYQWQRQRNNDWWREHNCSQCQQYMAECSAGVPYACGLANRYCRECY